MTSILCYGDSNTWGLPPGGEGRYDWEIRWPGVLQRLMGSEYRIIEQGLCGRTTCFDDPLSLNRNGLAYLPVALETHCPIDLLIIMLGTNDLKIRFNLTAIAIAQGARKLVMAAKIFEPTIKHVLLVSPAQVVSTENQENTLAFEDGIAKSRELAEHYFHLASQQDCHFFDAASVVASSPIDGIHLDSKNHQLLGEGIYREVKRILE